ncbi:hypothetical protein CJD36_005285 [Flavipsychrobacter stenotrophus]|uniref:Ig-like domain-containing protein n=1 Tax=Flavipsychrobacter stenotrophus TaxID=2077091 RepID=A0A2S7SWB4_9BACT|nr:choice-of-anchor L domain-containing protein [Flavipsychrobacter stenotrophus]PQJ11220.1 hypothetical protein CJD36_005285 [Flavipsychrobacter stenotrophus]
MQFNYTRSCSFVSYLKVLLVLLFAGASQSASAQITPSTGYTASQLVSKLVGAGVTTSGEVLTCASGASGEFMVTSSNLGLDCGVALTTGKVVTGGGQYGINVLTGVASGSFASVDNLAPGDAALTTLAGQPTKNACILEFDFIPSGDTIRFNYVFGSEEYPSFTCSNYNDVFGFLISGPGFGTGTNIALIPGTNIPVCINSVNSGVPSGGYLLADCNSIGPGSPFPAYFVNNAAGTSVTYDGFTTVLQAKAAVTPCTSYHLKLGIADAVDGVYDSGVFLEAGSLSSVPNTTLVAVGVGTIPYAIRSCAPGHVTFNTAATSCTPTIIKYLISGTAINGYDYATIADSVIIPPFGTTAIVNINPLLIPPSTPKTVILTVLIPDHCDPTLLVPDPLQSATLTIYDSFHINIVTPDTMICRGESVNIIVQPDTIFGVLMVYNWTPAAGLSSSVVLSPTATPTTTTTYIITGNVLVAAGCPDATDRITITVYDPPVLTVDSILVKTCVGVPVNLHVNATPVGVPYDYSWASGTYLSSTSISNPVTNPFATGDITYTVTVNPTAQPLCKSTATVTVHTLGDYTVGPVSSNICFPQTVTVTSTGSTEFSYVWTPSIGVATSTSRTPVISDSVVGNTVYTVTSSYANCPDYVHTITIHVDTPANLQTIVDTICLGMSTTYDVTVPGGLYYHYQWSSAPSTVLISNDTSSHPIFTPSAAGSYVLTSVIQPISAVCAVTAIVKLEVLPNVISVHPTDTAICLGQVVQVIGSGHPAFSYQWLPTAGIGVSNVLNALITPDTSALYTVTAHFHSCPDIYATLNLQVQPTPTVYIGGNRPLCEFDTLHINASVLPAWFTGYTYTWSPAADLDNTSTSTVVFDGTTTTTLHLVVTSSAGCTGQDSAVITLLPGNFAAPLPDLAFCPHDTAILNPAGGAGLSYHWYPSIYISDSLSNSPVIRPIASQSYYAIVTNANGCKDTVHFNTIVHPAALISVPDSVTLYPGENYPIEPITNCTTFTWFPYTGLSNPLISNPVATPDVSTLYIVKATTEYGCKAVDSINIIVNEETLIAVPNAFTPGTGVNGEFKIIKRGIANLNYFRIFNRWGNMVYESKNIDAGWDGSWKGEPQPFGVYVYSIQAVTSTGKVFNKQGNVTVIR